MNNSITKKFAIVWFVFAQILTIPANALLTLLLKLKVARPAHLTIKHGTLIVANHQSRIDPFLISYHIGFRNIITTLPIRYPVTPEYINRPILGLIIKLLGGYSIGSTPLERLQKLMFTRDLLKQGYTVVLFPEGKIVTNDTELAEFKRGAEVLFADNFPVVFVRLVGLNEKHKFHFWQNTDAHFEYSDCYEQQYTAAEKALRMISFFDLDRVNRTPISSAPSDQFEQFSYGPTPRMTP